MTKCRGANLEAGRFFLTDDNDENISTIIYADGDDDNDETTNKHFCGPASSTKYNEERPS